MSLGRKRTGDAVDWNDRSDTRLRAMAEGGELTSFMAQCLGVSASAIRTRLKELNIGARRSVVKKSEGVGQ